MLPAKAGFALLGMALLCAVAIPLGSIGIFRIGIWHQVESVIVGLHGSAALATAGLIALAAAGRRKRVMAAISQPLVVIAALLGLWSLLAAPFVKLPGLSVFGAAETGEGAIWYLDLATLIAAATLLKRRKIWSAAIPGFAILATGALAALQLLTPADSRWVPLSYTDYLATHGLFTAAIVLAWRRRFPPAATWIGLVVAGTAIAFSRNTAAIGMVSASPILWFVLRSASRHLTIRQLRVAGAAVVAATAAVVTFSPFFASSLTTMLDTRARLFGVAGAAIADHPISLISGFGWGAVTDLNFEYLHIDTRAPLSPSVVAGPTGEMLHFHSHNAFIEALISAGAIGLILSIALLAALPLIAPRARIVAVTLFATIATGIAAMWFQLAASLPLMAIALAASARGGSSPRWRTGRRRIAPFALVLLLPMAALQTFAAVAQYDVAHRAQVDPLAPGALAEEITNCRALLDDYGRGGRHLAYVVGNLRNKLVAIADGGVSVAPETAAMLDAYLCASDQWMNRPRLLQVAATSLGARTDLAFRLWDPVYNPLRNRTLIDWEAQVLRLLEEAPERGDIARHYFYWRMAQGQFTTADHLASEILQRRPGDPVGLWFKGLVLSRMAGRQEEARVLLVEALRRGAVKMMDVDHEFLASLGITIVFPDEGQAP